MAFVLAVTTPRSVNPGLGKRSRVCVAPLESTISRVVERAQCGASRISKHAQVYFEVKVDDNFCSKQYE